MHLQTLRVRDRLQYCNNFLPQRFHGNQCTAGKYSIQTSIIKLYVKSQIIYNAS